LQLTFYFPKLGSVFGEEGAEIALNRHQDVEGHTKTQRVARVVAGKKNKNPDQFEIKTGNAQP
jgi:hypothetical protein